MREIKRTTEVKKGRKWVVTYIETDEKFIYQCLSSDLIAKKINQCTYIKSIKRVNNYDGTENITVVYDNGCRNIYTIASH